MRINELRLSNILSFKYEENIDDAHEISFDPTLNVVIGGNGSGKSTALEAINFIFSRVLLKHYRFNKQFFDDGLQERMKDTLRFDEHSKRISPYRLQPNWNTKLENQKIKTAIALDQIDKRNIQKIIDNHTGLKEIVHQYSRTTLPDFSPIGGNEIIELTVLFSSQDDSYSIEYDAEAAEHVKYYLENYMLINEALILLSHRADIQIDLLSNTFTMLSAFRNYESFSLNTSLQSDPQEYFRSIRAENSSKSNHTNGGEPSIFNVVKLQLGEQHYQLMQGEITSENAINQVNNLEVVKRINEKLKILNLEFSIQAINTRDWSYEFKFRDTKHLQEMGDINSLSAGQKSIIHLIFEAYGQGAQKGGVVIIDEPEIHLHYQFQYEYLRILDELSKEQKTQYILVTHSDGFISSSTARYIKRFSLNEERNSVVHAPKITYRRKKLVEILDNTQASRVLFANKAVLVEGQDDEYFFRAALKSFKPELSEEIAVYEVSGKENIPSWKEFFESFGVIVYTIKDLDAAGKDLYGTTATFKLGRPRSTTVEAFRSSHADLLGKIESEYLNKSFYLKAGVLEAYTLREKGIEHVIRFCEKIDDFLGEQTDEAKEIVSIIEMITD